MADDSTDR
uniref:Uncharacterized protein n=1 Tax=Arundo donax TaxID=35708 RepID=A0A0A9FGW7_ARUDO